MKILLTLMFGLFSLTSFASSDEASILCNSVERVADAGYSFSVARSLRTASLQEQTIAGPRHVADFICKEIFDDQDNRDPRLVSRACRQRGANYSGLVVYIEQGGYFRSRKAELRKFNSVRGHRREEPVQFGKMRCELVR